MAQFLDLPERRLLVAVLADAVRILLGTSERQRARVIQWIKGGQARIPFYELCLNLELDPSATAKKLIKSVGPRRGDVSRMRRRAACAGRRNGTHDRRHDVAANAAGRAVNAGALAIRDSETHAA